MSNKKTTKISFGKIDGHRNGKKNCEVIAELSLSEDNCFSASAAVYNFNHTDYIMGGQCFDTLLEENRELEKNPLFMEIYKLWKKYHLNDMHAGTPIQEAAIEEWKARGNQYDYEAVCNYLKKIDLYEVPIDTIDKKANPCFEGKEGTYRYGSSWLKERIPEPDIKKILFIIKFGKEFQERWLESTEKFDKAHEEERDDADDYEMI